MYVERWKFSDVDGRGLDGEVVGVFELSSSIGISISQPTFSRYSELMNMLFLY